MAATLQATLLLLVDTSVCVCALSGQLPGWHVARLKTRVLMCDGVVLLKLKCVRAPDSLQQLLLKLHSTVTTVFDQINPMQSINLVLKSQASM